ncbi:MAG: GNAT family N-acetyltransferase [Ignavibacteria bacterium]|jgi:putative hemolysin|nr:GNAT family N-acetyltransferase [Ignavibacteria bacterium]
MSRIDIQKIIETNNYSWVEKVPNFSKPMLYKFINKTINANEMNKILARFSDKRNFEFIDELFKYLNFSYSISHLDKLNIPAEGKVVCVSNHPLGALDGLAILHAISRIRRDVLIVANDLLQQVENLKELFLPYNVISGVVQPDNIKKISEAIKNDYAVIFFPAAVVSRLTPKGIRDGKWSMGAMKLAMKHNAPILPIYIQARNSTSFYCTSIINKSISMLLLPNEIFNKTNKEIVLRIGNIIPPSSLAAIADARVRNKLLKKHVYKLNKRNFEVFKTEKTIIHPVESRTIVKELSNAKLLATTQDNKSIYSVTYTESPNVVKEIARLREITFRKVGEGTGKTSDFDRYDKHYNHIVLWDNKNLEIIGSYRIGFCRTILENQGISGLYNAEEFNFSEEFQEKLPQSLEMGRSFIQQKYWMSNALDYLWQGICAFKHEVKDIKYMFGAVSISNTYSEEAKAMIVYYYTKWFGDQNNLVTSKNPYFLSKKQLEECANLFNTKDKHLDFRILKSTLRELGLSVPTMFRRYTELVEEDGVVFTGFNKDMNFSNCVDGFIILDINKIKKSYKLRYNFIEEETK